MDACLALATEYTVTVSGSRTFVGKDDDVDIRRSELTGIVLRIGSEAEAPGPSPGEAVYGTRGRELTGEANPGLRMSLITSGLVSTPTQRLILELEVAVHR